MGSKQIKGMFIECRQQRFVGTAFAVVEAAFSFFVQREGVPWHAVKFHQAPLGVALEALNPVDADIAPGGFVFAVIDPKVFVKAVIR